MNSQYIRESGTKKEPISKIYAGIDGQHYRLKVAFYLNFYNGFGKRRNKVKKGFYGLYDDHQPEWSGGFLKRCAKVQQLSFWHRILRWIRNVKRIKI